LRSLPKADPIRVRTIVLTLVLTFTVLAPSAAHATEEPAFVYGGAEVTRWVNSTRPLEDRITLHTGRQAAHYFNGLVVGYLRAVARAQQASDLIWRWAGVAECESGGNPSTNTGNGYYGAYQFSLSTWRSVGGSGYPHQNSLYEQTRRADILRQRAGLGQWPICGSRYR
jgi:hypothetical protein